MTVAKRGIVVKPHGNVPPSLNEVSLGLSNGKRLSFIKRAGHWKAQIENRMFLLPLPPNEVDEAFKLMELNSSEMSGLQINISLALTYPNWQGDGPFEHLFHSLGIAREAFEVPQTEVDRIRRSWSKLGNSPVSRTDSLVEELKQYIQQSLCGASNVITLSPRPADKELADFADISTRQLMLAESALDLLIRFTRGKMLM